MKKSTAFLALATTLMSGAAFADIGSTSTTTSIGASAPRLIDKLVITDVAYMSGPSITNPNSLMPDEEGEPGKAVNIENFLGLGYKLSPDLTASANMDTIYTPVSFKDGDRSGSDLRQNDAYARLNHAHLLHRGNLNSAIDLRAYAPISAKSQTNNLITKVRTSQYTTYDIPNSRLQVGVYSFARAYVYGANKAAKGPEADFLLAPNANFQATEKVALTMWVDAYQPVIANGVVSSDPLDIEPGVSIDITKNINLNPYLNIYPGAKNLIDATSINMIVTAKLL